MITRVVQDYIVNFKHWNFIWDLAKYYSLGQKQHIDAKILKIEHHLGIAVSEQSFTIATKIAAYEHPSNFLNFQATST